MISTKTIKIILQTLLLSVIVIVPFIKINTLYFPFVSGKVFGFRLLVILAVFFWVWLLIKDYPALGWSRPKVGKNIIIGAFLLFLLAQIITAIMGVSPAVSFFSTIERQDGVIQYGFWVLYFLMLVSTFKTQKEWKILISVFIVTAVAISGYAWINLASQFRLAALFGNPSYLAGYLLFAIGFCAIAIERKFFERYFFNTLLLIASGFFAATIFYTQTRGVYLGLAGAIFLFCLLAVLFLRGKNPEGKYISSYGVNKKLVVFCAIILAIGVVSIAGIFLAKDTSFVKNSPLARITEVTGFWEVGSIRERLLTWQIALEAFKDKPIFGYGPENFMVAFNKHYDFRIGRGDSWFDRTHNIFLEPLVAGGIVLFSAFLFLLVSIGYTIFKIAKKERILSFILSSIFLAYLIQGMFLFDALPMYLGLFPFLAFVVYTYRTFGVEKTQNLPFNINRWQKPILIFTAFVCLFGIYTTIFLPYKASAAAIQFMAGTSQGYYAQALPFAKETFAVASPYTYWELKKRVGWQLLSTLETGSQFTVQEVKDLSALYDFVIPELERFAMARPYDPQIYFVLPRMYRLGYQKLGKNDLEKARLLLEKGFTYSDTRVEYYNEMAQVLLLQGKFSEGEKLLKDYADRMKLISFDYFSSWIMGNYYYVASKYDLALENYKIAETKGYDFTDLAGEFSRYIDSADKTKQYQEIVNIATKYLERWGPNADIYFNIALGDYYLGDKVKAKEYFQKAIELNKEQYQQYAPFFGL